jgi:hypothetical protein
MANTKLPDPRSVTKIAKRFEQMPVQRRMAEAVTLVLDHGWNQTQAAKYTGVSRSRLNVNVGERRKELAESQARSEAARAERVAAFDRTAAQGPGADNQDPELSMPLQPGPELFGGGGAETTLPVQAGQVQSPLLGTPTGDQPGLILPEIVIPSTSEVLRISNEHRRVPPPGEFIRMYFGGVVCPDCGVHHEVPDFHDRMLDRMNDPGCRRLLVNVAPYHAKSTIGTVYDSVYKICEDPNIRIGIVSKAERLAKNFLFQIKKFLTDPNVYGSGPNLIDDWGPFHNTNSWSNTEIYVAGRQSSEKDPTVAVFGVGALIYGWRFDVMKFDDIADLENQKNPDRVAEMLRWAVQECASRVGKSGKLHFMGTRISPGDIYSYLQNLPAYEVIRFPCITDETGEMTLWPEHFPYRAAVEQRDSMTLEAFQLVYQNIDTPGFGAAFPLDVLERSQDTEHVLGMYDSDWRLVLGVDPAGAGEQAGFTAMVVLGVNMTTGERHIVDIANVKQMRAPQIKDQILQFADQYPLTEIRVEVNGLQSQLFQYDRELVQRITDRGIRLVPHITGRNKWDPQFGVESMGPLFYNGQIKCAYGDINSRKKVGQLHEQLAQFPMGAVTDLVMALWFAELGCREIYQRFKMPAFDERMKMPARIRNKRRVIDFGAQEVRPPSPSEVGNPHQPKQHRALVNVAGGVDVYG